MKPIRNSVKAVIRSDDALLLIRKKDAAGEYFIFPGGGQDKYEDMKATLRRECLEEIGVEVVIEDILLIREYIGKNHEFAPADSDIHQIELYFSCRLEKNAVPKNGSNIDDGQLNVEWVPLSQLGTVRIYPQALRKEFLAPSKVYFGDIN